MKHNGKSKFWRKFQSALRLKKLPPATRKLVIGLVGSLVLLLGTAMIVLPGPAVVFVPLGLAILATEFAWAKQAFRKARTLFRRAGNQVASK